MKKSLFFTIAIVLFSFALFSMPIEAQKSPGDQIKSGVNEIISGFSKGLSGFFEQKGAKALGSAIALFCLGSHLLSDDYSTNNPNWQAYRNCARVCWLGALVAVVTGAVQMS